jgi:hypothetical protein
VIGPPLTMHTCLLTQVQGSVGRRGMHVVAQLLLLPPAHSLPLPTTPSLPGTAVAAGIHSLLSMTLLVVNRVEGSAAASSSGDSCSAVLGVIGRGAPTANRMAGGMHSKSRG